MSQQSDAALSLPPHAVPSVIPCADTLAMQAALAEIRRHRDQGELLILLEGAPGTGKSHVLRRLAEEAGIEGQTCRLLERGAHLDAHDLDIPDLLLIDEAQDLGAGARRRLSSRMTLARQVTVVAASDVSGLPLPRAVERLPVVRLAPLDGEDAAALALDFATVDMAMDRGSAALVARMSGGVPGVIRALVRSARMEALLDGRTDIRAADVAAAGARQFLRAADMKPAEHTDLGSVQVAETPPAEDHDVSFADGLIDSAANDAPDVAGGLRPAWLRPGVGSRVAAALLPVAILAAGGLWFMRQPVPQDGPAASPVISAATSMSAAPSALAGADIDQTIEPQEPTAPDVTLAGLSAAPVTKAGTAPPAADTPPRLFARTPADFGREDMAAAPVALSGDTGTSNLSSPAPPAPGSPVVVALAPAPAIAPAPARLPPVAVPDLIPASLSETTGDGMEEEALAVEATRRARDVLRAVRN